MVILDRALEQRAAAGDPVRIGLVGAGYIARGIAAHAQAIRGIELVAISNRTIASASDLFAETSGTKPRLVVGRQELESAIAARDSVVTDNPEALCGAEGIDAVIEATGEVEFGAQTALSAIAHRKHVVLANAELASTLGPLLKVKAEEAGVLVSYTGGDEPGVAMDLLRYVRTIGLEPVVAGNIKGFLDRYRNPETQRPLAESLGQKAWRIASYADGTKLAQEAAILADAAGYRVAERGMKGYRCAHVNDVLELLDDVPPGSSFVDYVLGAEPGSGVFVVARSDDPIARTYLEHFKLGKGPLYLFYVPWHLPQAEAPLTAARMVLFRDAAVAPLDAPRCEVFAVAKRDLRPGEEIDGGGGFTCYGSIDNVEATRRDRLLPLGVAPGCTTLRDVPMDQPLTYDDVELPADRLVDRLREEQEELFFAAAPA
jgi:predicted homoserine dehydrogenase-like protein